MYFVATPVTISYGGLSTFNFSSNGTNIIEIGFLLNRNPITDEIIELRGLTLIYGDGYVTLIIPGTAINNNTLVERYVIDNSLSWNYKDKYRLYVTDISPVSNVTTDSNGTDWIIVSWQEGEYLPTHPLYELTIGNGTYSVRNQTTDPWLIVEVTPCVTYNISVEGIG